MWLFGNAFAISAIAFADAPQELPANNGLRMRPICVQDPRNPMKTRTSQDIRSFLHQQVEFWNSGKKTEMFLLYHQIVPGKMTIEYVGLPVLEGWTALEDMWQRFAGKVHIDVHEVMVTGLVESDKRGVERWVGDARVDPFAVGIGTKNVPTHR